MLISIIIPAYNGEKHIAATIGSVLAQTYQDWELIVVDDGSRDATVSIAQAFAEDDVRIRLVRQEGSGTAAGARNGGLRNSDPRSRYLLFLDHDDVLEPNALTDLFRVLEENPEYAAAYGLARFIDLEGRACRDGEAEAYMHGRLQVTGNRLVDYPRDKPLPFSCLMCTNWIFTPGQALIRRTALETVGEWDPSTHPSDDHDLWIRLSLLSDLYFLDKVVLGHRQHESNQSKDRGLMGQSGLSVRRKWLMAPGFSPEQRRIAMNGWRLRDRQTIFLRLEWSRENLRNRNLRGALQNLYHASRSLLLYFRNWGVWRPGDYLPLHRAAHKE